MKMAEDVYELKPIYSERKSFYGKALVLVKNDGSKSLKSYNTIVAHITKDNNLEVYGQYSPTTGSHINEFMKQNGFLDIQNKYTKYFVDITEE